MQVDGRFSCAALIGSPLLYSQIFQFQFFIIQNVLFIISKVFYFSIIINPNCSDDEGEPDDEDDNEDDDDDNETDEDDHETFEDEEKENLDEEEEHSKENGVNCNGNSPSSKLQNPVRK